MQRFCTDALDLEPLLVAFGDTVERAHIELEGARELLKDFEHQEERILSETVPPELPEPGDHKRRAELFEEVLAQLGIGARNTDLYSADVVGKIVEILKPFIETEIERERERSECTNH